MLTDRRWQVELLVMDENFPQMEPFQNGDRIGFQGLIRLYGRSYEMVVEGLISHYPQIEPKVYLNPHPEEHHWYRTGGQPYLCYRRDGQLWSPARSTLASCVAVAIKYIKEFS